MNLLSPLSYFPLCYSHSSLSIDWQYPTGSRRNIMGAAETLQGYHQVWHSHRFKWVSVLRYLGIMFFSQFLHFIDFRVLSWPTPRPPSLQVERKVLTFQRQGHSQRLRNNRIIAYLAPVQTLGKIFALKPNPSSILPVTLWYGQGQWVAWLHAPVYLAKSFLLPPIWFRLSKWMKWSWLKS